jgi:hypothetical protein
MFLPEDVMQQLELNVPVTVSDLSSPTISSFALVTGKSVIRSATYANGLLHYLVKYDVTQDPSGQKRTKMRKCKLCFEAGKQRDVGQYCASCREGYSLCNKCGYQDCFSEHIKKSRELQGTVKKKEAYLN